MEIIKIKRKYAIFDMWRRWNVMKKETGNEKRTNEQMKWIWNDTKIEIKMKINKEYEMQMRNCNGWNKDAMTNVIKKILGVKW